MRERFQLMRSGNRVSTVSAYGSPAGRLATNDLADAAKTAGLFAASAFGIAFLPVLIGYAQGLPTGGAVLATGLAFLLQVARRYFTDTRVLVED